MSMFITLGDIISIAIGAVAVAFIVVVWAIDAWRKGRCKHLQFNESRACDAICTDCGKNLGFIGTVRAAQTKEGPDV